MRRDLEQVKSWQNGYLAGYKDCTDSIKQRLQILVDVEPKKSMCLKEIIKLIGKQKTKTGGNDG